MSQSPRINLGLIQEALHTSFIGKAKEPTNELWDSIDSTNERAKILASQDAQEGTIILARQQTAGRGRHGKTWVSPLDAGIYLSVILRPTINQSQLPLLSLVAGVAAYEAIKKLLKIKIGLKWVNDLIWSRQKLGGILAETQGYNQNSSAELKKSMPLSVILGIGINLHIENHLLPDELKNKVVSLDEIAGAQANANLLVAELCLALESNYSLLCSSSINRLLEKWKASNVTLGQEVCAYIGKEEIRGIACDLDSCGGLIVQLNNGNKVTLQAGEISIRLKDGSYV